MTPAEAIRSEGLYLSTVSDLPPSLTPRDHLPAGSNRGPPENP